MLKSAKKFSNFLISNGRIWGEMSNRAESYAKELVSRFQYPDRQG
jgi:hypothetical protein